MLLIILDLTTPITSGPISMAERSKANVCGRSLAVIAGSNPVGSTVVCLK
jgi:hypothetical protein